MSEKRVSFYQVATHLGGAERSTLSLIQGLKKSKSGYRPWVIVPKAEGPFVDALVSSGIEYDVLPMPQDFFKMSRGAPILAFHQGATSIPELGVYAAEFLKLVKRKEPVLIHTSAIKCHALAAMLSPVTRTPILWHLRDILTPGPTHLSLKVLQKMSKAKMVANSNSTATAFGLPGIQVVYNGIDPKTYRPEPNRGFNQKFGVADSIPIIGIVGVLARWKGQVEFLQMAARLVSQGVEARFVVVGGEIYDTAGAKEDRGYEAMLKNEAERLGISDRVLFTGFMKDQVSALNGIDVLVHASIKPEPFGRVIIEAMACKIPVIASAAGGVLEILEHDRTGLLCLPTDVDSMVLSAKRLLSDPGLKRKLVAAAYEEFLSRFTEEKHCQEMIRVYDKIRE